MPRRLEGRPPSRERIASTWSAPMSAKTPKRKTTTTVPFGEHLRLGAVHDPRTGIPAREPTGGDHVRPPSLERITAMWPASTSR